MDTIPPRVVAPADWVAAHRRRSTALANPAPMVHGRLHLEAYISRRWPALKFCRTAPWRRENPPVGGAFPDDQLIVFRGPKLRAGVDGAVQGPLGRLAR
jgi:hypothetical protein